MHTHTHPHTHTHIHKLTVSPPPTLDADAITESIVHAYVYNLRHSLNLIPVQRHYTEQWLTCASYISQLERTLTNNVAWLNCYTGCAGGGGGGGDNQHYSHLHALRTHLNAIMNEVYSLLTAMSEININDFPFDSWNVLIIY